MNNKPRNPTEALDKAISKGGTLSCLSSHRPKRMGGKPGEIIEKMDPEDRKLLEELKSDDISEDKIGKNVAWLNGPKE